MIPRLDRRAWIAPLVAAGAVLVWRAVGPRDNDSHWLLVARDSSYSISIDTTRIDRIYDRGYEIWYRTDHVATRYYNEEAFNRETVEALLLCRDLRFKVARTAFSMGGARPVSRQINTQRDVDAQPWRRVEPGSIEADAAHATCVVGDARWMGR